MYFRYCIQDAEGIMSGFVAEIPTMEEDLWLLNWLDSAIFIHKYPLQKQLTLKADEKQVQMLNRYWGELPFLWVREGI